MSAVQRETERKMEEMSKLIKKLEGDLARSESEKNGRDKQIEALEKRVKGLEEQLEALKMQLTNTGSDAVNQRKAFEEEISRLKAEHEEELEKKDRTIQEKVKETKDTIERYEEMIRE